VKPIQFSQVAPMNLHYVMYSFESFLDSLARLEVESLELWAGYPHLSIEDTTLFQVGKIGREIRRRGLAIACLTPESCIYPINIAAEEEDIRTRSLSYYTKALHMASELGVSTMQIVSGWGYFNKPAEEAWKRSRASLERLLVTAEQVNVRLTLEPLLPDETNLVNDLRTARRMLEEIRSPYLGINADTVPMAAAGDTLPEYFRTLGSRLTHVHLCDGPEGHVAWGDGSLPLHTYVRQLADQEYGGYLGLELCEPYCLREPERVLKQSIDAIRTALAEQSCGSM
jgi:protein FrlC